MKRYRYINRILCPLLCVLLLLPLSGCGKNNAPAAITESGFYFDTVVTLTFYDQKQSYLFEEVFSLCDTMEKTLSRTVEGSDIWKINHAQGSPVAVSEDTIALLQKALYYAELSGGLVDPTIAGVSSLWDFTGDSPSLPDSAALLEALTHVDYRCIDIDPDSHTVTLTDPQASLDLGFIAKGYIADRIKEYLLNAGVDSAIVNLGGNTLCIGEKPDGSAYQVGIQYPFGASGQPITVLSCRDISAVTSGIYERCFYLNDTLYHHILNPENGYPAANNLLSVTILSSDSVDADALSTLCYLSGLSDGMALVESIDGTEAVFITDDYELHYTSGLSESNSH